MKKAGWVALFLCAALWMVGVTGSAVEEGTPLPVLMYHALLRNPNAWNDYVLSPDALEQDLIWLKAHGYSFVLPSQVIGFVQNRNPLPEKPVMITLDDGCLNHLTYLPEILERQDACAFLSVVGEYTEKADAEGEGHPEYSYLRSEDIGKLLQTGRVEIGNHSYNLHGLGQRPGRDALRVGEPGALAGSADRGCAANAESAACGLRRHAEGLHVSLRLDQRRRRRNLEGDGVCHDAFLL